MRDELITFETAKLAKEKGYDLVGNGLYKRATQSLLQRWLREVHNCHVEIIWYSPENGSYVTKENIKYYVEINYYGKDFNLPLGEEADYKEYNFDTYEKALEKGLQEALKLIK